MRMTHFNSIPTLVALESRKTDATPGRSSIFLAKLFNTSRLGVSFGQDCQSCEMKNFRRGANTPSNWFLKPSMKFVTMACTLFLPLMIVITQQRQTGISVSYRKGRYQALWYQYQSRSRLFLSLGIIPGIDPEACAFFVWFWQNSY